MKTIHIVDDEYSVRAATAFLLELEGYSVRTWQRGAHFLAAAPTEPAGCVILDLRMPDMDGLEVQRRLNEADLNFPVIMLTGHGDIAVTVAAMKMGAVDFLVKPFERQSLLQAVENAWSVLHDNGARRQRTMQAQALVEKLTPRERDVLAGLTMGLPNKHIALQLGISPRTIEIHRANLMAKLKTRNLSDALRVAFAAGIGRRLDG
ncbi:response regulator transcription factor [Sphingobium scionense]|jgi:two-component system response regulator FixJ|uniref:Two-component system response regulator FixJ n=2 Tax=Sphingobium TaxID=165695 RepID=A0A7W6PV26_9SPHN|nr:response regulator [Sphingobium scionense]MBB4148318.1 two-component system response regulator FixJ [Sphingobium scionense]